VPAVTGLAIVLAGDPVRRMFFSKAGVAAGNVPQQISL
jgi:APA family basic amino acid/polyamine antiporter